MASRELTLRLNEDTYSRLQRAEESTGRPAAELASAFVEEGLRMQTHPGIIFRSGPAGRRPGLANGPDIWEVARVLRALDWSDADKRSLAEYLTGLAAVQLETAQLYYLDYRSEIDAWLQRVDDEADAAFAESTRQIAE